MATKNQLIAWFANGLAATGEKFEALITSLKGMQSPVNDPSPSGNNKSVTFISNISQNEEGVISPTKKTVDFSGYQTTANMSGYQNLDLQQVNVITVGAGESQTIRHEKKHYPTVRLIDSRGIEIDAREYVVEHVDDMSLVITLRSSLVDSYKYILD